MMAVAKPLKRKANPNTQTSELPPIEGFRQAPEKFYKTPVIQNLLRRIPYLPPQQAPRKDRKKKGQLKEHAPSIYRIPKPWSVLCPETRTL